MERKVLVVFGASVIIAVIAVTYLVAQISKNQERITNSGEVSGRILTAEGKPLPKAKVFADKLNSPLGRRPSVLTNQLGEFRIKNLEDGIYIITAEKTDEGYSASDSVFHNPNQLNTSHITISDQSLVTDVTVYMPPKATKLIGSLSDKSFGSAVGDATIKVCREDQPSNCFVTGLNIENKRGGFELLLPPVPVTIEVTSERYKTKFMRSFQQTSLGSQELRVLLERKSN